MRLFSRFFGIETKHRARSQLATQLHDPVQYGLRFQILPDSNAPARTRELAVFCHKHRISAVHLFMNAEEWNRGHMTEAEIRKHLIMFRRIVPILHQAGLSVHLNLWSTTLHCSRGRRLRAGQPFECMVSPTGKQTRAVASFACLRWRQYLVSLYGRMAAIGFETLWLEDDWRYHNHGDLDWGGDFSDAILSRFAQKIGRPVTRAEVVRKVLQPGRPHPWRKQWLALWRACQEEAAAAIRDAVAVANSRARLGIMSSGMDTHSAEGRDWHGLFRAMAINGRAVHRPHFASYGETTAVPDFVRSYVYLDIQKRLRPSWVNAHPEIENFPFGRFGKSNTTTYLQMALAKIMGSEGLLLDLHPMTGNSVWEELGVGEMLDKSFPALAWLSRQFPRSLESRGVGVPFKADAAENIRLAAGAERWTDIVDCMNKTLGAGLTVFRNVLGGRVAVSAVPLYQDLQTWNLNFQRQTLVQHLIRCLARRPAPVMTSGAPHMFPIDLHCGTERKVVVANLCLDPGCVIVTIPGVRRVNACTVIRPLSKPEAVRCRGKRTRGVLTVMVPYDLPHYSLTILSVT